MRRLSKLFSCGIIAIFATTIFSCSDSLKETSLMQDEKLAYIRLSLDDGFRTVLPVAEENEFTSLVLKGSKNGESECVIGSWESVAQMQSDKITVAVGTWTFTLSSKISGTTLTGKREKEIILGENSLAFTLSISDKGTGTGSFSITLNYADAENAEKVSYAIAALENTDGTPVENISSQKLFPDENSVTFTQNGINAGTYRAKVSFYGSTENDGDFELASYRELVRISTEMNSTANRTIESFEELYSIAYVLNGGEFEEGASVIETFTRKTESISFPNIGRIGYVFDGWYSVENCPEENKLTEIQQGTVGDITLYAKWTPCTDTSYRVEHYKENPNDDDFTLVESDTQNLTGTTDGQTVAEAKSYEHYTAQDFDQKTIAADGSTVVKIYYKLETVTMTFSLDGGKIGDKTSVTKSGKYGASYTIGSPTKTGWSFSGWNPSLPETMTGGTFTATYSANTNTPYKVEHYKENVTDDNFTLVESDTQNLTGTTDGQTLAEAKSYKHYTAQDFDQKTIAADGSTVVKIYYKLETVTMTFSLDGGKIGDKTSVTKSGKYGASYTIESPTKTGWSFSGWNPSLPENMTGGIFTATYSANTNTPYKVEHYKENVTDDNFTLVESDIQNLTGTTDGQTLAEAKSYEHYTAQDFDQKTIAADGSTVVKIYYKLDFFTMTFNLGGGNIDGEENITKIVKYGASYTVETPQKVGYDFSRWIPALPENATDGIYTATYTPRTDTPYKVGHYLQNANDDGYTLKDTDNLIGTTTAQTDAQAKNYEHFLAGSVAQTSIEGDGSTEIKIYYTRELITFTLELAGGTLDGQTGIITKTGRYGQYVIINNPGRTNYIFAGWNSTGELLPDTYETDKTYTALWSAVKGFEISIQASDISVTKSTNENIISFTAEECDSYSWILNDVEKSTERTFSIDTSTLKKKVYTLALEAQKGGKWYSYYAQIKVTE
ncbi:MAG TPA: hypothetical protein DCO72_09085 [Ruminococcus sp.]|nr:hypothetical protein [Ruminococcus sp.]